MYIYIYEIIKLLEIAYKNKGIIDKLGQNILCV